MSQRASGENAYTGVSCCTDDSERAIYHIQYIPLESSHFAHNPSSLDINYSQDHIVAGNSQQTAFALQNYCGARGREAQDMVDFGAVEVEKLRRMPSQRYATNKN